MHLATLSQSSNCVRYLKELGADVDVEVSQACLVIPGS